MLLLVIVVVFVDDYSLFPEFDVKGKELIFIVLKLVLLITPPSLFREFSKDFNSN
jgi:hypothetical protein